MKIRVIHSLFQVVRTDPLKVLWSFYSKCDLPLFFAQVPPILLLFNFFIIFICLCVSWIWMDETKTSWKIA